MKTLAVAALCLTACSANPPPLRLADGTVVPGAVLARGRDRYRIYCAACHGERGDGRGPSGIGLRPPPRDFTQGLFEFGGTLNGGLPPDGELARIVTGGLGGTAMLPWDVPAGDLDAVLAWLKTFSPRWRSEPVGAPIEITPDPWGAARDADAIAVGRVLYHTKARCMGCHPAYVGHRDLYEMTLAAQHLALASFPTGMYHAQPKRSDYCLEWRDPAAPVDERECRVPWRVVPTDFVRDPLRNVRLVRTAPPATWTRRPVDEATTMRDLYRTIAAGIPGAAMPTWKGVLDEKELWALVHYVRSLVELADPARADARARLEAALADPANLGWAPPGTATPPAPSKP